MQNTRASAVGVAAVTRHNVSCQCRAMRDSDRRYDTWHYGLRRVIVTDDAPPLCDVAVVGQLVNDTPASDTRDVIMKQFTAV